MLESDHFLCLFFVY